MSDQLVNDGLRYTVLINDYFHQQSYVVYEATIIDQCFNNQYHLCFRFKSMKIIHQKLIKNDQIKHLIPQFPKTRSFLFVNKTNRSLKNIQNRARQLEYYISKILNTKQLTNTNEIKTILSKAKNSLQERKTKSQAKRSSSLNKKRLSACKVQFKPFNHHLKL